VFAVKKIAGRKKVGGLEIRSTSTSFSNAFKTNTKRVCSILIMTICLLSIMNCEALGVLLHPDPEDFEYHTHDLTLHVKAINHSEDTLGVKQAVYPLYYYLYERNEISVRDHNICSSDFPETLYVEIPPTDTEVYIYETEINHFIGYQEEYGGDSTRYSCLDKVDGWFTRLSFLNGDVMLNSGDSRTSFGFWVVIPDTVRGGEGLDVEIIFDLNGLFYSNYPNGRLSVNEYRISCRQM
jgi:hypothetical protein